MLSEDILYKVQTIQIFCNIINNFLIHAWNLYDILRSDFDLTMKINVLISYVLCDLLGFSMTINRNLSRLLNCVLLGLFMFDFSSQASSCPSIYCWCNNNIFIIIRNNVFTTCRSWAYFRWSYFACVNNNYFSPYNYFIKKIGRENYLFNLFKI